MFGWMQRKMRGSGEMAGFSGAMAGFLITGQGGFVSGTHVASNRGWRAVEVLCVGDKVLTFDSGMQVIVDIQRETLVSPQRLNPQAQWPVLVPRGAMGNRREMWLMPEQGMLVESDAASDALGDPFAVVPARALAGLGGIRIAGSADQLRITTLAFAGDEVIYVEGGMLAHCPRPLCILTDLPEAECPLYNVLDMPASRRLVHGLIARGDSPVFVCDPEEIAHIGATRRARPCFA
jgi:Hint domain